MAIQVTPPEKIGFSRNPIVWRFQNDNAGYVLGSAAENAILFSGPVASGTTVVVRWNGEEQKLKASASPGDLGAEFPAGDGSAAYVDSLVAWFAANYYFNEDFAVVASTVDELPALVFQARHNGKAYNFSSTTFAGGECRNTVAGVNSTYPINAQVYVEVWVRKGVELDFERVYHAPLALNSDSNAEIDVNEILHAELTPEMPSMVLPMGSHVHDSRLDYYLKYAPAGGENFSVGQLLQTDTHYCLLGGTSYEAGSGATVVSTVLGLTPALDRFLSLQDTTRYVYRDQPAFVSFINLREDTRATATLRVTVHFTDESTQQVENTGVTNLLPYQKAMWAVGYNQLNLAALNTEKVVQQYKVQLFEGATPISEELTFVVLYDYKPYRRHFAYVNSVGGIDTLSICGKGSPELTYFREQAEQVLPYNYESHHGQFVDWDIEVQESFDAATGWLREQDFLQFRDFFRSTHKYRVVGGASYPIGLTTNSIRESRDGDNQRALLFQYTYLFRNRSVSLGDLEKDHFLAFQSTPPPGIEAAGPIVVGGGGGIPYTGQIDPYPIPASLNPVTSGGVFDLLTNYQPKFSLGTPQQIRLGDGSLGNIQTVVRANQEHRSARIDQTGEVMLATKTDILQGLSETKVPTARAVREAVNEIGVHPWFTDLPVNTFIVGQQSNTYLYNLPEHVTPGLNTSHLAIIGLVNPVSWASITWHPELLIVYIYATFPSPDAQLPYLLIENREDPLRPTQSHFYFPVEVLPDLSDDITVDLRSEAGLSTPHAATAVTLLLEPGVINYTPWINSFDFYYTVNAGGHTHVVCHLYQKVGADWVARVTDVTYDTTGLESAVIQLFGDQFSSNTVTTLDGQPLEQAYYMVEFNLFSGDSLLHQAERLLEFQPPVCDVPPVFSTALRPDAIYDVTNTSLWYDFHSINVLEQWVYCWKKSSNEEMWKITAAPGVPPDTLADARQYIEFPYTPDDTYILGIQGKSCSSAISKMEFVIGNPGTPAQPTIEAAMYVDYIGTPGTVVLGDLVQNTEVTLPWTYDEATGKGMDVLFKIKNRKHNGYRTQVQRFQNGGWFSVWNEDLMNPAATGFATQFNRDVWAFTTTWVLPYFEDPTPGLYRFILTVGLDNVSVDGAVFLVNLTTEDTSSVEPGTKTIVQNGRRYNYADSRDFVLYVQDGKIFDAGPTEEGDFRAYYFVDGKPYPTAAFKTDGVELESRHWRYTITKRFVHTNVGTDWATIDINYPNWYAQEWFLGINQVFVTIIGNTIDIS